MPLRAALLACLADDEVCSGEITLRRAQRLVARNWVKAYRARFG